MTDVTAFFPASRTRSEGGFFLQKKCTVREAEFNIRRFKALWERATRLTEHGVDALLKKHDAMAVLELLEGIGEI